LATMQPDVWDICINIDARDLLRLPGSLQQVAAVACPVRGIEAR